MLQELKFQLSTAILTVVTVAAAVSAGINFQQQLQFRLPDDGVTWVDRQAAIEALRIAPESSAARAGLHPGDVLKRINNTPVEKALHVTQILVGIGVWNKAEYLVSRGGVEFPAKLTIGQVARDRAVLYQYLVGAAYLMIGLFVYYRRGSAHKARHFYVFCLASFIFSTFHYTGKLNGFDKVMYYGNVAAGLLAPALYLHFCLTFPEPRRWLQRAWRQGLLYLPAALLGMAYVAVTSGVLHVQDRVWLLVLAGMYLAGGIALSLQYERTDDAITRQQLKWLRNGVLYGVAPFTIFYVLPYAAGFVPNGYMKMSVLSLTLVPLTLAYAILRYRLMDVDILFRRGYAYTLATLCVLAGFYGMVFSLASLAQKSFKDLGQGGLVALMLVAAFLFQPVRNWLQERLDRYFYRDRYDYRRTLIEFARELSSETNLEAMLSSVAERLIHTLSIRHLAFFLADEENPGAFDLQMGVGLRDRQGRPIQPGTPLDLSFLSAEPGRPHLFFERTRYLVDAVSRAMPATARQTISDLDLTYYLPCTVRGRTIAFLGASRTESGDFLSSVDVELLQTLSGYVAIAIDNARLYRSLQRKVEENERLKEFSENIVESINVGILAADLEDRVESWNTQVEELTGIRREKALGRKLAELLPADLVEQLERVRGESGIHHIYKFILRPAAMPRPAAANGNGHPERPPKESTLNIAIAPLVSREFEQIGRLIIFDDVTERAELERRLLQADKLSSIGLLAAGVAHEVNTPLAVISTYAQMMAKQVAGDEAKSKLMEKIAKQTFRASEIVNSLLNFSRTSTTEFGAVSLTKVIQETLSLVEHQMQKAGLEARADLDAALPAISGNPGKLQQVFLNLFLNARDAMPSGGRLEVKTWHDEDVVRIEVTDTGCGISPEHVHRIYDPFFTTKGSKKGTGLGLSVTYGIIQEHGGSIKVFPRPEGGTGFHLVFPRAFPAMAGAENARTPVNA
ncbi:MAG: PAS domain S-box protein [Candidatus Solibacter usitatus]|nr:PAS domain S-box protein [Candidatus Solibacter usitatus]